MWRISWSNSIIRWQDYRVAAPGLAESNFRHTQGEGTHRGRGAILRIQPNAADEFRCAQPIPQSQGDAGANHPSKGNPTYCSANEACACSEACR